MPGAVWGPADPRRSANVTGESWRQPAWWISTRAAAYAACPHTHARGDLPRGCRGFRRGAYDPPALNQHLLKKEWKYDLPSKTARATRDTRTNQSHLIHNRTR